MDHVEGLRSDLVKSELDDVIRDRMSPLTVIRPGLPGPTILYRLLQMFRLNSRPIGARSLDFSFGQTGQPDSANGRTGYEAEARLVAVVLRLSDSIRATPFWSSSFPGHSLRIDLDSEVYGISVEAHGLLMKLRSTLYAEPPTQLERYDRSALDEARAALMVRAAALRRYHALLTDPSVTLSLSGGNSGRSPELMDQSVVGTILEGLELNRMAAEHTNAICDVMDPQREF